MSDVVVHVVADRRAAGPALTAVVRRDRYAEFNNLGPERIVVVLAVDAVKVDIRRVLCNIRILLGRIFLGECANGTPHTAADVDDFKAESLYRDLKLLYALL